jgi:hypothetical protein
MSRSVVNIGMVGYRDGELRMVSSGWFNRDGKLKPATNDDAWKRDHYRMMTNLTEPAQPCLVSVRVGRSVI